VFNLDDQALPVRVKLGLGADPSADPASWILDDVTDDVIGGIAVVRGRGQNAKQAEPSRVEGLTLANPDGRYSPLYVPGPNYPNIRRGVPIQIELDEDYLAQFIPRITDTFGRSVGSGWGTPDAGPAWGLVGAGGSVVNADWSVNGSAGIQSVPVASAYRISFATAELLDARIEATVTCAMPTGGALEPCNLLLRYNTATSTYYMFRISIAPGGAITASIMSNNPNTTIATVNTGLTHAAATPLRVLAECAGPFLRFKVWQGTATSTPPATWTVTATSTVLTSPGSAGIRSGVAAGNTNTKPVLFTIDDVKITAMSVRFGGTVAQWLPDWPTGNDDDTATVTVKAFGSLYRPGKRTSASWSPLRRRYTLDVNKPIAFWSCEDGSQSTQAASGLPGGTPMTTRGTVSFAGGTAFTLPRLGTLPLADLSAGGALTAAVDPATPAVMQWCVQFWAATSANVFGAPIRLMEWSTPFGDYVRWAIVQTTAYITQLIAYDASGAATTVLSGAGYADMVEYRASAIQSGSDITVELSSAGYVIGSGTLTGKLVGCTPVKITANPDQKVIPATAMPGQYWEHNLLVVGQIGLWATINAPRGAQGLYDADTAMYYSASLANAGEAAHNRVVRVCTEHGIAVKIIEGSSDFATAMGGQPSAGVVALWQDCERTDDGILTDMPFGMAYVARSALYNRPISLNLDVTLGQVKLPFQPTYDDQSLVNDVEVTRPGGSSARIQADGDLSPDGIEGPYDDSPNVNVYSDYDLPHHASWRVHEGTVDEMRVPALAWDLALSPELAQDWINTDIGHRVKATGVLPTQYAGGIVDMILGGYTERFDTGVWTVQGNGNPASAYTVGVLEDPILGRLDTDGSQLFDPAVAAANGASTTFRVAITAGPLWITKAAYPTEFPFDVAIAGTRWTVTDLTTVSSVLQTFTAQPVDGVVRTQPVGTPISLWQPAILAL
jgi:hypothetical protein